MIPGVLIPLVDAETDLQNNSPKNNISIIVFFGFDIKTHTMSFECLKEGFKSLRV